mmetsp:Transcript_39685/g.119244  ORF Transcript_39685/g.119244 Transcript_39685/m.119244 type:complete len:785 (-) Transcript_39685:371-2725(-)
MQRSASAAAAAAASSRRALLRSSRPRAATASSSTAAAARSGSFFPSTRSVIFPAPSPASNTSSSLLDGRRRFLTSSSSGGGTATMSSNVFKKWPEPVVESRGDYREESYLETLVGGPLYRNQSSLPRLPIPPVKDTIAKLIPTCLPLAEDDEERRSFLKSCDEFPREAEDLQRRLTERRDGGTMKDSSWLQSWWNTAGYLEVRDPVVVNVSYFFHFADDPTLPPPARPAQPEGGGSTGGGSASLGIKRGAAMLFASSEYRKLVCSGSLPCESVGRRDPKTPLCSVAFKYMFNACRIPRRGRDGYRMYDPSLCRHAVVARRGRFYAVDIMDGRTGDPLPVRVIEERLGRVVRMADDAAAEKGGKDNMPMMGWLTSSDRDSWADAREELIRAGGDKMERALEVLESGSVMLCLDDEEPTSRKQCGELFWTGSLRSGHNRWFDKSIQLLATNNGKSGMCGEHSMMDGMPVVGMMDHVTGTTYRDAVRRSNDLAAAAGDAGRSEKEDEDEDEDAVRDIFEECAGDLTSGGSKVEEMVEKAKSDFADLISAHELEVQSFRGYGSTYIKSIGYSPDAYVQMAIQLATYRLWGKQAGTYEATQMRPFLHGRTETTRGVSLASERFVKRMGLRPTLDEDETEARKEKLELLRDAAESHVEYIGAAAKGRAIDRHLLGLSMILRDDETPPELYSHPLYVRSKTWRVSTSHLTHPRFENWGYGEVVHDGVGLSYGIKAEGCVFNITARREHGGGGGGGGGWDADQLSHLLEEALIEMQLLNEMERRSPAAASRL